MHETEVYREFLSNLFTKIARRTLYKHAFFVDTFVWSICPWSVDIMLLLLQSDIFLPLLDILMGEIKSTTLMSPRIFIILEIVLYFSKNSSLAMVWHLSFFYCNFCYSCSYVFSLNYV